MAVGGVLAAAGVVLLLAGGSSDPIAARSPSTSGATLAGEAPAATDPPAPPSSAVSTTVGKSVTSTTLPPTTIPPTTIPPTTIPAVESFDAFLVLFRRALDGDDVEFLLARLHPQVAAAYGEELCRGFVAGEIVTLDQYQATGDLDGPTRRTLDAGGTSVTLDGVYDVDVSFTFQGQAFDRAATFVLEDGIWYWTGQCR